ncbi:hypothetical protein N7541_005068 [Penicillium brevicompactum]|uniref:Uncharacterized protein n=1 Tax=Penicillium brevicompactum TaxID=5074 RepID=A0A9W9UWK6_PENBR|nr:hypothetical protein N7541_005068 [Penicillium brevicompactum]
MTLKSLETDVLIIGAGPAGLMASTWMAQTGIKAILIDQKPQRTQYGHADGVESRTFEILDSFGLSDTIWKNANRTIDLSIWNDCEPGGIRRRSLMNNCNPDLSRFQEATLGQGQIEQNFLDFIEASNSVEIKWNTNPLKLTVSEGSKYPVRVNAQMRESDTQTTHCTINAKYLLGCDGAHSWVRAALGLRLHGAQMDEKWGVIDSIPLTDFPDIRKRCIVKSEAGHLMIIPRERRLVRCYVQLTHEDAAALKKGMDSARLVDIVRRILRPYKFEVSSVEWSTIYSVGQRLCPTLSMYNRVFLAGDAIHTHSPKAGQGMNVSIQDAYNLGWKLACVIKGKAKSSILRTYQEERLQIALRLLAFDKRMVQGVFQKDPSLSPKRGPVLSPSMKKALDEENTSASGITAHYKPSCLITRAWGFKGHRRVNPLLPHSRVELAGNLAIGERLPDSKILFQCDSRPYHLQKLLRSTGEWYLLVFGGDISNSTQMNRVRCLGSALAREGSLVQKINRQAQDCVGEIAFYLIHSAPRKSVELLELPNVFVPFDDSLGHDYWRVLADNKPNSEEKGVAYHQYGIGDEGCIVLARPDQHVAFVGSLEDLSAVELFLGNFVTLS